jgi:putative membrane protein insertion efficiency factor
MAVLFKYNELRAKIMPLSLKISGYHHIISKIRTLLCKLNTKRGKLVNDGLDLTDLMKFNKPISASSLRQYNYAHIIFFGAFFFISNTCTVLGQSREDIKAVSNLIEVPQYATGFHVHKGEKNVTQAVTRFLYDVYKSFISSQDGSHCSFYPSCSQYALQSIRKKGFLPGLLNAFDRLSRCNGLNSDEYPVKKGTNLLYDPVE